MNLRDVFYISYALPAKTVQPLLPNELQIAILGDDIACVSLVALRSTQVRLSCFPVIRFNYYQFNIRTYVIDPVSGQLAVYFIRSGVTSRFISLATRSIGIPWESIEFAINFNDSKEARTSKIFGDWEGHFSIQMKSEANSFTVPSFFQDKKSAVDFLIRPLIGFSGSSQRLIRFTIQHPEVKPETWMLEELDCPLLNKLLSIDDVKNPHSVFYLPTADFSIYLPSKSINIKG
jgi:hypothetical protein